VASAREPLAHTSAITLFRDLDRIEIQNEITQNFNAVHTWGFSFAIQNPDVYHEEVGAILRTRLTTDGGHYSPRNARYDWLTLNHFVDINQNSEFGITISNPDCYFMKFGNSTTRELDVHTPQISVLVGANDLNGEPALSDQGGDDHFVQRFALKAHDAYDPISAMRFAMAHQNPLATGRVNGGDFYPPDSYSLLTLDNPNVLLWALKPAEDGMEAGFVARLWNLSNQAQEFSLSMNDGAIASVLALTHIETPMAVKTPVDGRLVDTLNQQQLKTYALFPSQLPYRADLSGLTPASAITDVQVDATPGAASVAPSPTQAVIETQSPATSSSNPPESKGKGCLPGLLVVLFKLFR
jgi:alpha-mannosidase